MALRRIRWWWGIPALLVLAVAGIAVLSWTPPNPLLRRLVIASTSWVLPRADMSLKKPSAASKLIMTYVEYTVAGKMARTVRAHDDPDDVARIDYTIRRAQLRTVTANEVPHAPREWPVLVSGLGYCDQVNAAVCQILAHFFPSSQLYATWDPKTKTSPHTIGRVWSPQRKEWLYFDAFGDRPIVFRRIGGGKYEILNKPVIDYAGRLPPLFEAYGLDGFVINEYAPTFGKQMVRKIFADPPPPHPDFEPLPPLPTMDSSGVTVSTDSSVYERIERAYVAARAEDLFGDSAKAKEAYLSIVRDPQGYKDSDAQILQDAARRFAGHLR